MNSIKSFFTKLTVLTLSMLLVFGASSGVMAKSFSDIGNNHDFKEQIDILSDIGVIVGTSENEFSPNEDVTREQMAMFLFRIMLGKNNAGTINTTAFEDLYDKTYNGAVSWANAAGYIIGTTDTTFEPTGGIMLQDAMTMIVRALGQSNTKMDSGYPWTYIDAAIKLGLDKGLEDLAYGQTLTRAQTAAILYNALTSEYLIPKTASNGNTYLEKTTIIENVFGYEINEAAITATNSYSIDDKSLVVKTGYVTVTTGSKTNMTVNFEELGLTGTPNEWLGKSVTLIYKIDPRTNLVSVLGSSYNGKSESFTKAEIADNNSFVSIDDVKYNVVSKLSDSLATNANELLVYAYGNDGKLVQVKSNDDLRNYTGVYNIEMIYDNPETGIANRAILKNYKFGKLSVTDEKINIADGLKQSELTGGLINTVNASNGDHVLYYFNSGNRSLEISKVLTPTNALLVSKLNASTTTIGGSDYKMGSMAAGVSPADIRNQLTVGSYTSVIAHDGVILAVVNGQTQTAVSKYLITLSNAMPVYTNGKLQYVVSAYVDGTVKDIVTDSSIVSAGLVYRYVADSDSVYTLIPSASSMFTQNTELSSQHIVTADTTLSKNNLPYYTLNKTDFITDSGTKIIVKNGNMFEMKNGSYASTILLREGANVTAVYTNNPGNVETLLFLYISDGSLGTVDASTQYVKVLAKSGAEYINGSVYTVYEVVNFNTGIRESRYSLNNSLMLNTSYALDSNGYIINTTASTHVNGLVSGYTASTLTVDGNVYKLASDVKIIRLDQNLSVSETTLASIYQTNVEFVVSGNEVRTIIASTPLTIRADYKSETKQIIFTPSASLNDFDVKLVSIKNGMTELNVEQWSLVKDGNSLSIQLYNIDAGNYTFTLSVNNVQYVIVIALPEITAQA